MFCSHCGKEVPDQAYVCMNCGCLVRGRIVPVKQEVEYTNGIAVAGFICAFIMPLLGWIFGGIGYARALKRNGKGKGLSLAALFLATINFTTALRMLMVLYG